MAYLLGFLIGTLVALTGVGAGTITAPILMPFLGIPLSIAVRIGWMFSAAVKLILLPAQVLRGNVDRIWECKLKDERPGVEDFRKSSVGSRTLSKPLPESWREQCRSQIAATGIAKTKSNPHPIHILRQPHLR